MTAFRRNIFANTVCTSH